MEQRAHLIPTFIHTFHIRLQLDLFILFILDYNQIYSYISYQTTTRFIHTFHISHTSQHLNQIRTIHSLAQIRFELVIPWLRLDQNQSFLGLDQIRTSHSLAQIRLELAIPWLRLDQNQSFLGLDQIRTSHFQNQTRTSHFQNQTRTSHSIDQTRTSHSIDQTRISHFKIRIGLVFS